MPESYALRQPVHPASRPAQQAHVNLPATVARWVNCGSMGGAVRGCVNQRGHPQSQLKRNTCYWPSLYYLRRVGLCAPTTGLLHLRTGRNTKLPACWPACVPCAVVVSAFCCCPCPALPLCARPSCTRCVPQQQLGMAAQTLADPLLNPIKAAMTQFTPSLGAGETALAAQLPLFERLATMFDALQDQQVAAASILQQAWAPLDVAMLRAGQDRHTLERLCRCGLVCSTGVVRRCSSCRQWDDVCMCAGATCFGQCGCVCTVVASWQVHHQLADYLRHAVFPMRHNMLCLSTAAEET